MRFCVFLLSSFTPPEVPDALKVDAAAHSRTGVLGGDDPRFGVQHLIPPCGDGLWRLNLLGKLEEGAVVPCSLPHRPR